MLIESLTLFFSDLIVTFLFQQRLDRLINRFDIFFISELDIFCSDFIFNIRLNAQIFNFLYNWCYLENRKFCVQCRDFGSVLERQKNLKLLHSIGVWIFLVVWIFQNFLSYRSIRSFQIATDCSVFDRFCFYALLACFDWSMDYIVWYKPWRS